MVKLMFLIVFFVCLTEMQGCHVTEFYRRKRRNAEDDYLNLRSFFDVCMANKYGDSEGSFITEVDYVILDSVWYDSVGTSSCIDSNDEAACWKDNLDDLIVSGEVGDFIKTCIDEYEEETFARRKKRAARTQKTKTQKVNEYLEFYRNYREYSTVYPSSLEEVLDHGKFGSELGGNTNIKERGLGTYNYQRLSAFIQTQTLKKCGPRDRGYVEDWKSRFVLLTKEKSDLYEAIAKTARTDSQELTYSCSM